MSRIPKRHLPYSAWPIEDRALWAHAFERDVFDEGRSTTHLASATIIGLRASYARYLGFLAVYDPERLQLAPPARIDPDSIREFVEHLRQSCRDTSVVSLLHKLGLALGFICPQHDFSHWNFLSPMPCPNALIFISPASAARSLVQTLTTDSGHRRAANR